MILNPGTEKISKNLKINKYEQRQGNQFRRTIQRYC